MSGDLPGLSLQPAVMIDSSGHQAWAAVTLDSWTQHTGRRGQGTILVPVAVKELIFTPETNNGNAKPSS